MNNQTVEDSAQSLANVLPCAIIILEANCHITWWNNTAQSLFELNESDIGLPVHHIIPLPRHKNILHIKDVEISIRSAQDKYFTVSVLPYANNHYLLLARDLSSIHQIEKVRRDFFTNISHELRTPLTVILGYLEMLQENVDEGLTRWSPILDQMFQQSLRMESLVNNILLLSRLEANSPQPDEYEAIEMSTLLEEICKEARGLSGKNQHSIMLFIDTDEKLFGSIDELRSAFSNLIFNAVKYTPQNGEISIRWKKSDSKLELSVKDNGIGIDAKHIPRLTERFYRVDRARSRVSGGTGLGLAIVKHVLIRHQATLNIDSKINSGSTFTCTFN